MPFQKNSRYETYIHLLKKSPTLYAAHKSCITGEDTKSTADSEEEQTKMQVNTCVLGPAVDSFVLWVLQNAQIRGIKRLYFLARDGYLMYRTALRFCEAFGMKMECRYLYCSRYSLRIPVFHLDMEEALEYICRGGIDVTLRKILLRSGITEEEQNEVIQKLELPFQEDEVIPYARLEEVRSALKNCSYFLEKVRSCSETAYPALEGYLIREGLTEDETKAVLVDSGWVGSMQKTLNKVLKHMGRTTELEGFYWGLYELPEDVDPDKYHSYYFSPKSGLRRKVYFSNCLFESVFSAPHGMTLQYQKKEETYTPCLAVCPSDRKRFMEETEAYIERYTENLIQVWELIREPGKVPSGYRWKRERKVIEHLLRQFMGCPVKEEAEVYGRLFFSDDVLDHDQTQETAPRMTEQELRANHVWNKMLVMLGIRHMYIRESAWYEGSVARSESKYQNKHRKSYQVYKYLLYIRQSYLKGK